MVLTEREKDERISDGEATLQNNGITTPDEEELARTKSAVSIAETFSLPHEILFISTICMAQFMTQGALGNCLNLLHVIGASFSLSNPAELSWLIAGYSLTVGTFILVSGRLGDVFGYKRLFLIGFVWFALWSMIAGLATYSNHVLFVFARVFQGIGPAIVMPNGLAILGASYHPGPRKTLAFALFGACAPGGNVFAAAFAGLFVKDHEEWWPWAFYSFAIGLAAIAVFATFIIPDPPHKLSSSSMTWKEILDQLDLLGAITGITALVLFNFAWNQAPIVGWETPYVYVLLIIGVLLVPVFFYIELRVASNPLIPFDTLTSDVGFILACVAGGWASFGIWIYYTWEFFQLLRGGSPLLTAAWMSPVAVSGAIASLTTAWLLHFTHPALVMLIALVSFTVGTILMMTAPVEQNYWFQSFFSLIIMTWGMDMSFPAATLILSNSVKREHQGIAASLVSTVVNYSISLGLGFAATVEVHVNNGGETMADLLFGYRAAWYMAVGFAGLGLGISIFYFIRRMMKEGITGRR
ncbi:multidrug-resistance type transporter aminotriazole resistance [Fusarium falciforme]|uniref:Multidrug-resistance type transporter aminotriazole resistance n=1 Tax=Fusarium falciforme TaxID=195108 RepID=A0A9W8UXG7_9HYPO|nr:multidrug-resistance type transporter aminotriazole resistance [Fusarium falciforme]KAJ4180369.1 multidrug-resistance type transporter aminotriazole resistance [Fusarium falciforme]KAJ4247641.1 multidrug-resistance type transporter aminotriazole resistance [Fusarium falciforme]